MRLRSRRTLALVLVSVSVAGVAAGLALWPRPAGLVVPGGGPRDTIVVNSTRPTSLAVSVVDQYGRPLPSGTAVHFRSVTGTVEPSPAGVVTCKRRDDAVVRASFAALSRDIVLHCRPVVSLEAASWLGFVVGDSASSLPFVARGLAGEVVTELRGELKLEDSSIAGLVGTAVQPKKPGRTFAVVAIGDARAIIAVMVYRPVKSFVGQPRGHDLLAMRVRLARGDTVNLPVPKAVFWVTYVPSVPGAAPPNIVLVGPGSCTTGDGIHVKNIDEGTYARYCRADTGTRMQATHGEVGADTVAGTVALQLEW